MNEGDLGLRRRSKKCKVHCHPDGKTRRALSAEAQRVQLISTRTPLSGVLDGICSALDCQMGNIVSLISLPGDEEGDLAAMAMNAALFGLHTFYSEPIVADDARMLGSLEMYCSVRRRPSASEFQLIERAKRLATTAIELDNEANHRAYFGMPAKWPLRGCVLQWPVSINES